MEDQTIEPKLRQGLKEEIFGTNSETNSPSSKTHTLEISVARKNLTVFVIGWTALTLTFSSTAIFSATEEIAHDFDTSRAALDLTNAIVFMLMGSTSFFWAPLSEFIGRKLSYSIAIFLLICGTLATACSREFRGFFASRIIAGLGGTYLILAGQTIIVDVFEPSKRGQPTSCLMIGCLFGPALGPCLGGLVVTYSSWRAIFWIQTAMAVTSLAGSILVVPAIYEENRQFSVKELARFNPFPSLAVLKSPQILLINLASGLLGWLQYCLLVTPRHLINPRFGLTTPLVSGLFYLSPGFGFILGAFLGGRISDWIVVQGLNKNNSVGYPHDRLRVGLWGTFCVIPASCLVYGWTQEFEVGGLACPIVAAFFCSVGLMFSFTTLNLYCAEALPKQRNDVIMTKYFVQYCFGAVATATAIPLIEQIGVGLTFVLCSVLVLIAGFCVVLIIRHGSRQDEIC